MIQVEHLTKHFGDVRAVNDISFRVGQGEVVGFLGPNGAGKSTTMRILTCFLRATAGTARIAGCSITDDSLAARRHIGYLPETVPLYQEMRVREYLSFRARLKGVSARERHKRIESCLDQCGINDMANRIIGTLSRGYRQRVGLAESLIHDPDILILDEPTVGLDPNQIRLTRHVIKSLAETHTILLSTHILPEVEMVCERFIIIAGGRLAAMDTMESLTRRSVTQAEIMGPPDQVQARLSSLPGVTRVTCVESPPYHRFRLETGTAADLREAVYQMAAAQGWPLRELLCEARSLEEVFVEATLRDVETEEEPGAEPAEPALPEALEQKGGEDQ